MAKAIKADPEALKGSIDDMRALLEECANVAVSLPSAGSDTGLNHNRLLTLEKAIADSEAAMTSLVTLTVEVLEKSYAEITGTDQAAAASY